MGTPDRPGPARVRDGAKITSGILAAGEPRARAYADGNGPSCTYTPAGLLQTRTWERTDTNGNPVTTAYAYDRAGSLTNTLYSDTTPSGTNYYNRLGQMTSQVTANYQINSVYNLAGSLLSEAFSGAPLNGLSVSNQPERARANHECSGSKIDPMRFGILIAAQSGSKPASPIQNCPLAMEKTLFYCPFPTAATPPARIAATPKSRW